MPYLFGLCGPGSANLVVALAAAMMDSSAFLAITGNVPTSQFNRMPFQETGRYHQGDFPSVIRPYVKRSYQPTRVDMVPLAVRQGWELMLSGRPGPGPASSRRCRRAASRSDGAAGGGETGTDRGMPPA